MCIRGYVTILASANSEYIIELFDVCDFGSFSSQLEPELWYV